MLYSRLQPWLYSIFIQDFCYSFDTLAGLIWNIVALVAASISDSLLFKPRYLTREKQYLTSCTQHSIYKWYFVTKIVLTYTANCLFTFGIAMSAVCLHFYRNVRCLFTFAIVMSAVCLHLIQQCQLFVYILQQYQLFVYI